MVLPEIVNFNVTWLKFSFVTFMKTQIYQNLENISRKTESLIKMNTFLSNLKKNDSCI